MNNMTDLTRSKIDELKKEIEVDFEIFNKNLKEMTDSILTNDDLIQEIENKVLNEEGVYVYKLPKVLRMLEPANEYPGHNILTSARLHDFMKEEYFKRFLRFWKDRNIKVTNYQILAVQTMGYKGGYDVYDNEDEPRHIIGLLELIRDRYEDIDYTRLYFQEFKFEYSKTVSYLVDLSPSSPKTIEIN